MSAYLESQQIHLLPVASAISANRSALPPAVQGDAPHEKTLEVPSSLSYLVLQNGLLPCIAPVRPDAPAQWSMIEAVSGRPNQPRLLLISPPEIRARVNGQIATRIVVLKEKDQFQFDADWVFHVTLFNRPRVGDPPAQRVGQPCSVCRVPLDAQSKAFTCACGQIFHCDDSGGLECARLLSECTCGRPVVLKEGFTYLPA